MKGSYPVSEYGPKPILYTVWPVAMKYWYCICTGTRKPLLDKCFQWGKGEITHGCKVLSIFWVWMVSDELFAYHKSETKWPIQQTLSRFLNDFFKLCKSETLRRDPSKYWQASKPYMTDKIKATDQSWSLFHDNRIVNNPEEVCNTLINISFKWHQMLQMKILSVRMKILMISYHAINMTISSIVSP